MDPLARPIFIVAPPQSGTTYLFDVLGQLPEVRALDRAGREAFDSADELRPEVRGHDSNRRTEADATAETGERIRGALRSSLPPDGDGAAPGRLLDATPRNSLRLPFLDAIFPDAQFVYVYRQPRDTVAGMVEAWRSGKYVTYPELPDWPGPPWSLLLVPGWRELVDATVPEIAATQWTVTTRILLDDLEQLPPERWCVVDYPALEGDPLPELERLCGFLDLAWDPELVDLGDPRTHLAIPAPEAQARREERLQAALPRTIGIAERARDLLAAPVSRRPTATPDAEASVRSLHTGGLGRLLDRMGAALLLSTYATGKLICARRDGPRVNTHFRDLPRPTGLTVTRDGIAVATRSEIWRYRHAPEAISRLDADRGYDACLIPHTRHLTGEIGTHELAQAGAELWLVASRYSCLATLDERHSFVPRWRPSFVTELADEDRCHLTGVAVAGERPAYATALGRSNEPHGWRQGVAAGGCLIDVESGEVVAAGLSLPNSPRLHRDRLWLLESGEGALCTLDLATGEKEVIARLPGFTRGLGIADSLAFVGLSRLREDAAPLPLAQRFEEHFSGVWVVDLESGETRGYLRFEAEVSEVYDLAVLSGYRFPEIADPSGEAALHGISLPKEVDR